MEKKATKRQKQAMEAWERIRASAIELFAEQGFDQVTIENICQKAGVSTGLLYNYFPSKEAILVENFQNIDEIYRKLAQTFTPDQTARQRLMVLYREILHYIFRGEELNEQAARVAYGNAVRTGETPMNDRSRFFFGLLRDIAAYARERDEWRIDLSDEDAVQILFVLTCGMNFAVMVAPDQDACMERTLRAIDQTLSAVLV